MLLIAVGFTKVNPFASYMHYSDPTECQDGVTNNCTQTCNRTVSNETTSYECNCDEGFQLNSDGTTCDGKPMYNK